MLGHGRVLSGGPRSERRPPDRPRTSSRSCAARRCRRSRSPSPTSTASCAASTSTRTSSSPPRRAAASGSATSSSAGTPATSATTTRTYTGWHTGYPDAVATRRPLHLPQRALGRRRALLPRRLRGRPGRPLAVCPRQLLKKVVARARGGRLRGQVPAWSSSGSTSRRRRSRLAAKGYVAPTPLTPGHVRLLARAHRPQPALLHRAHGRAGAPSASPSRACTPRPGPASSRRPSVHRDALEAADRAVLFKTGGEGDRPALRHHADLHGQVERAAARLQRPHAPEPVDEGGENVFYDAGDPHRMSRVFKSYLAGQLRALPELLPFFAPTVNSYKRLVDGYWAPDQGHLGRRQPHGRLPRDPGQRQVHARRGPRPRLRHQPLPRHRRLRRRRPLRHRAGAAARRTRRSRAAPTWSRRRCACRARCRRRRARLSESKLAREILGEEFVDHFVRTREWEWRQFQDAVTDWELRRYFEMI